MTLPVCLSSRGTAKFRILPLAAVPPYSISERMSAVNSCGLCSVKVVGNKEYVNSSGPSLVNYKVWN